MLEKYLNWYCFLSLLTPVLLLVSQTSFAEEQEKPVDMTSVLSVSKYYDWTGTYAGIQLGGGLGTSRRDFILNETTGDFDMSSVIGGITLGHNLQFGHIVAGLESDFSINSVTGNANKSDPDFIYKTGNPWLATLRPRLGYAFGSLMPYVTGGLAVGDVHVSSYPKGHDSFSTTNFARTDFGWSVGTGIEATILPNLSVKAEYLYTQLDNAVGTNTFGFPSSTGFEEHIWRLGVNYRFDLLQTNSASLLSMDRSERISLATLTGIELGGQISDYRYQEDPNVMHATGAKGGITVTATKNFSDVFFIAADNRIAFGLNDYSSPKSGSHFNLPDLLGEIRLLGGKDFVFDAIAISPYVGLGYRNLYNDARGVSSSGSHGYQRDSQYFYLPVGITTRLRITETSRISTNLEYGQLIEGWQNSYLSDVNPTYPNVTNGQYGGYELRGSVMYERSSWSIGPFVNYWKIDQSAVANCTFASNTKRYNCYLEPHNSTLEYGLQASYRF